MTVPDSFGFQIVTNRSKLGRLTIYHLTIDALSTSRVEFTVIPGDCNKFVSFFAHLPAFG